MQRIECGFQALGWYRVASGEVRPEPREHLLLRARLLRERSGLHLDQREWTPARERAAEALHLFQQIDELQGQGEALNLLSLAALGAGLLPEAFDTFGRALAAFERASDSMGVATVRSNLGILEKDSGNLDGARDQWEAALDLRRQQGDKRGMAEVLNNLGVIAQEQGEWYEAWNQYNLALHLEHDLRHVFGVARALSNLGEIMDFRGNLTRACRLFAAARHLFDFLGSPNSAYVAGLLNDTIAGLDLQGTTTSPHLAVPHHSLDEIIAWALAGEGATAGV